MALAGRQLEGGIRLVRPVGSGSHAVAYLAVTAAGRPCTVKLFKPHMLPHAQREWQVGRRFRHPRLTRLGYLTLLDDFPALVMSWVPGETLFARYRQRPALICEPQAYLTTLLDILEALEHMHGLGILHRDVKPDNILVQPTGHATLVDYDLSGPMHEPLGGQIGTPAFQSPEAQSGEELGPPSDLYGVGLLLHWGLWGYLPDEIGTGKPSPESSAAIDATFAELPPPVGCEPPPFLPAALQLLARLLLPDAAQRPTAAAVRAELQPWIETPNAVAPATEE